MKILNSSENVLAYIDNIVQNVSQIREINSTYTLSFDILESELKSEYLNTSNYIEFDGQRYRIANLSQSHMLDGSVKYQIFCEHVSYALADGNTTIEYYANTGLPASILTDILAGTIFLVGNIEFSDSVTLAVNEETTKLGRVRALASVLGGEIQYRDNGYTIDILNEIGQNNGFEIRLGRNLKGITKTIENKGELKTFYEINFVLLKESEQYKENNFSDLESIDIGDTVRVVDEVIGIDIEQRIIAIEKTNNGKIASVQLSNRIDLLSDKIANIQTTSIAKEKIFNGCRIGPDEGFVAERSDGKAKTVMNATEGITISTRSNIVNPYEKNFQIDADGNIVMKGKITLEEGSELPDLGFGTLAYEDNVDWNENLLNIPGTLKPPNGTGLFLSSLNLGFMSNGVWKTYMDKDGNFYLGGTSGKLQWNAGTNTLHINGAVTIAPGSAGISNFNDAGALATVNNLDGVPDGSSFKRTTPNEKVGAGRAFSGLDSSGDVVSRVKPSVTMGNPNLSGLYMGSDYLGFHNGNGNVSGWTAFIKNDGKFKFSGNANNFIEWDGSNLNIKGGLVADGVVTGGTIRTAVSGARIEMSNNTFQSFNSLNEKNGLWFGSNIGNSFGDIVFYYKDKAALNILSDDANIAFTTSNNYNILIGATGTGKVKALNDWDFSDAIVTGGVRKIHIGPTAPSDTSGNTIWIKT